MGLNGRRLNGKGRNNYKAFRIKINVAAWIMWVIKNSQERRNPFIIICCSEWIVYNEMMMLGVGVLLIFVGVLIVKNYRNSKDKQIKCNNCGNWINIEAKECPYCHRRVGSTGIFSSNARAQDAHRNRLGLGLLLICLGVIFIANALGFA